MVSTSEPVRVQVDPQTIIVIALDEATAYADDLGTLGAAVTPSFRGDTPDEGHHRPRRQPRRGL
jgi:hypothetical protein